MKRADVVVIGGGVIGLATALELRDRGRHVIVFEAGVLGQGATQAAGGMLAPVSEADVEHPSLIAFGMDSLGRYSAWTAALEQRSGVDCGHRSDGALWIAVRHDDMIELEHLARSLEHKGLATERLDARDVLEREPRLSGRLVGGLGIPSDHQVHPRSLTSALAAALRGDGVEVLERSPVSRVAADGGAWRVVAGDVTAVAGQVVLATGATPGPALHPAFEPLRQRPVKGQVVLLRAAGGESLIRHVVRTPEVYLVPRAAGELFIGATVEEMGFDARPTAGAAMDLLRRAWETLPGVYELEWIGMAVGLRPAAPDHLPLIGPLEDAPGLFASVGHYRNGILLAPASAVYLAQAMIEGRPPQALAPFLPARIAGRREREKA